MSVCRYHGGKTPVGTASPHFKTGKYSKHMPTRLAELYSETLADENVVSMIEEVRLCDTRILDCLDKLSTGESGNLYKTLREQLGVIVEALATGDLGEVERVLETVQRLVDQGAADWEIWRELSHWMEQKKRLVETEIKRVVAGKMYFTFQEVQAFLGLMMMEVRHIVGDGDVLRQIERALRTRAAGTPALVDRGGRTEGHAHDG